MRIQIFLPILILCSSFMIPLHAQQGSSMPSLLASRFISKLRSDNKELIIAHTNKFLYNAGEDLWFKAWVINKSTHKYFTRSHTLFADLVDDKDHSIMQLRLNLPLQQTSARLNLPSTLSEGYYWLRIFTKSLLQQDSNSIFVKCIFVHNNRLPQQAYIPTSKTSAIKKDEVPDIQFFPEGGALISGTDTKIGVKSTNKAGEPLALEGNITDIRDSVLTTFKTNQAGLGSCSIFVYKSRKYTANVKWNNQLLHFPLMAVDQFASQIAITGQDAHSISVTVSQGDSLYKKKKETILLCFSRDSLCFAGIGKDMYELSVPKNSFPTGIANFLLFNDKQEVVSQRDVFIDNTDRLISIHTDKQQYATREKVNLQLSIGDSMLHPEIAALSIAVTNDNIVKEDPSLPNDLGLAYYNYDPASIELAMLTAAQQYKGVKFDNEIPLGKDAESKIANSNSINQDLITGEILTIKDQPAPNRVVTLYNKNELDHFEADTTDTQGGFKFKLPLTSDSVPYTLQVSDLKGVKLKEKIIVNPSPAFPVFKTPLALKRKFSTEQQNDIVAFMKVEMTDSLLTPTAATTLKPVEVIARKKDNIVNPNKIVSEFSFLLSNKRIHEISLTDAGTALLSVPGLQMRGGFLTLAGQNSLNGPSAKDEPLLIIDGIPMESNPEDQQLQNNSSPLLKQVSAIPPDIIDFIEVLTGPQAANYGARSSNGVVLVNTLSNISQQNKIESYGSIQFKPVSYHLAPSFSAPNYNLKETKNTKTKDLRTTIYWNGQLYTNNKGTASAMFFTADTPGTYTIIVTGITQSGEIVFKKSKIKVQ